MTSNPLLKRTLELTQEILDARIEVGFDDVEEALNQVAHFHLLRAHDALRAVSLILPAGLVTPSRVLVRHLFELEVGLRFIAAKPEDRVTEYLDHRGFPSAGDSDLNQHIHDLLEQGNHVAATELMISKWPWEHMKTHVRRIRLA